MADFIPPKNEIPERELTEKAIESVSGERPAYRPEPRPDRSYSSPNLNLNIPPRRESSGYGLAAAAASAERRPFGTGRLDADAAEIGGPPVPDAFTADARPDTRPGDTRVPSARLADPRYAEDAAPEPRPAETPSPFVSGERRPFRERMFSSPNNNLNMPPRRDGSGLRAAFSGARAAFSGERPAYVEQRPETPDQRYTAPQRPEPLPDRPVDVPAQRPMRGIDRHDHAEDTPVAPPRPEPESLAQQSFEEPLFEAPESPAPQAAVAPVAEPPAPPQAAHEPAPPPAGRPSSAYPAPGSTPVKRQIVCFSFYKVLPEWRRLSAHIKEDHKQAFSDVLARWNKPGEFISLTYSTVGTRGDSDMCVWSIGYSVEELNRMRSELMGTPLGGYLTSPHNFLAMTKRSQYQIDRPDESEGEGRGAIRPGGQKYIFIYPFWKTRPWYLLSAAERKRLMDEHIRIGLAYPRVKLNTTYSFGIDDQEFVVAFETNFPEDFLDLVQQLRETEISLYTLKDFPIFSCVRVQPAEMLNRLG